MTLPVKQDDPEVVAAWLNSEDVREARRRSRYDDGEGSLRDLLQHLLAVVDEHEARDAQLPVLPESDAVKRAAADFALGTKVSKAYAASACIQMLDLGADPARLRTVFHDSYVDRAVESYREWRPTLVAMARHGATPEELHAAVPGIGWKDMRQVLAMHGLAAQYPVTAHLSDPRVTPEKVERRRRVVELHKDGLSYSQIATELDMTPSNVAKVMRKTREGKFPELVGALA